MASRFGYGNFNTLGRCREERHSSDLTDLPIIRFTKGFQSLETMRHAVFERRATLESMMNAPSYIRAIRTVVRTRRARNLRGEGYGTGRAAAIMEAYPVLAKTHGTDEVRSSIEQFLNCLRHRQEFAKLGERPFGVSFYRTGTRRLAHVLTYAHRRFYLWMFDGESTESGSWSARCLITQLLYADKGRSRILIDKCAPRKNPVSLRETLRDLPEYLRRNARIVSCYRRSNFAKRHNVMRGLISARTSFKIMEADVIPTSATWFIHAFMGHDVRGSMIQIPLRKTKPAEDAKLENDWFRGSSGIPIPPSVVISPESKYMTRVFALNKDWTTYRPSTDRAHFVDEHGSYRINPETGENIRMKRLVHGNDSVMCRMNREEFAALANANTTLEDFSISVETLARMESATRQ
jgi:hypothetical protein